MYIMESIMQVSKWGNSLAIRLPKALVEEMGLKEGDEVTLAKSSESHFDLVKRSRAEAVKRELFEVRGGSCPKTTNLTGMKQTSGEYVF